MAFCYCFVISQGALLVGLRVEHVCDSVGPAWPSVAQQIKLGEPVCVFRRERERREEREREREREREHYGALYPLFINHVSWLAASIYMYEEEGISSHSVHRRWVACKN